MSEVDAITTALDARDLPAARTAFDVAVGGDQADEGPLVRQLAKSVVIPRGMVVWGFSIDIWANPYRDGYAWRCGNCRCVGVNYATDTGAQQSAEQHVADHHRSQPPTVVSYLDEAYWRAVDAAELPTANRQAS